MGVLKPYSRAAVPIAERLPQGCYSVHKDCNIVQSTLPSWFPEKTALEIARVVLASIKSAQEANLAVTELNIRYSGLDIAARDLRGGALIFLNPHKHIFNRKAPPQVMSYKNLEEFILHLEAHIECWKQFNLYVNLTRENKVQPEDEQQFLELKSLITQGTESIAASEAKGGPRKEDVLSLFASAPSLRYLAEGPDNIATVEGQWHRMYLSLQSMLGQVKVQQQKDDDKNTGWSLFKRNK